MSRDGLAISRLFSSHIYKETRFFFHSQSVIQNVIPNEIVECNKKALVCCDCCDKNQAIILVV